MSPAPDLAEETEVFARYRSVSVPAIVGFLLGVASPVVFVSRLMVVVPLFGAAVSLVALAKISSRPAQVVGRWLAVVGLSLSIGVLSAALTRTWVAETRMAQQAEPVARQFLTHLAENEPQLAFELTTQAKLAAPTSGDTEGEEDADTPLSTFLDRPLVEELAHVGEGATVRLVKTEAAERISKRQAFVAQQFALTHAGSEGNASSIRVKVTLLQQGRRVDRTVPAWRVANFDRVAGGE